MAPFWTVVQGLIISLLVQCVHTKYYFGYSECHYHVVSTKCNNGSLVADKSNSGLTQLPPVEKEDTCLLARDNSINAFPADMTGHNHLTVLNLARNRIAVLPNGLDALVSLEVLDLSENQISKLYMTLRLPNNLQVLRLTGNNIQTIPSGIKAPSLMVLDVSGNELRDITDGFCMSDQLIKVDFTNNQLEKSLEHYVNVLNACPNANGIPFCAFTDLNTLTCPCNTLESIIGNPPAFQFGTNLHYNPIVCGESTQKSQNLYTGRLFDANATELRKTCNWALAVTGTDDGKNRGYVVTAPSLIAIALCVACVAMLKVNDETE